MTDCFKIDNFHYELCDVKIKDVHEFFRTRKKFLKITTIKWIACDCIFNKQSADDEKQFPILIFLN